MRFSSLALGPTDRHSQVGEVVEYTTGILDSLHPDIARAIATGNMERLIGLE